jgi:hypothetical protein
MIPGAGWSSIFQMKPSNTLAVPTDLHKVSCKKLCLQMKEKLALLQGVVILEGGQQLSKYDTDGEPIFR